MSFTRFDPPAKKKVLNEQLSERLRRTKKACEKVHLVYVFNRTTDKAEVELSIYRQRFPGTWKRRLMTLSRVRLSPGMFVINEEGDIDQDFKVKEALVYSISEMVYDPRNPNTNQLAHCTTVMGVYKKPNTIMEFDDLGNCTKSTVKSWSNRFYIPWDDGKSARAVIDEFGSKYRNIVLAIAREAGEWYGSNTYSVFNLQEWLEADFEDVLGANKGGFLKNEYGGAVQYVKDRDEKRRKLEAEIQEFEGRKKSDKGKS
jgi:hypothetical protein